MSIFTLSFTGHMCSIFSIGTTEQICCLIDDRKKCLHPAGNANYGKKIQKTVQQRKLKLELDEQVSVLPTRGFVRDHSG